MDQHLFSVEEANELIPTLEHIMGRMQQAAAHLRRLVAEVATETGEPAERLGAREIVGRRPEARRVMRELERLAEEIEASGGQFKGLDLGLVDFPTEINGEVVVLCWQYGEKQIGYWHTLDGGFAGRQPLTGEPPAPPSLQ